MDPIRDQFENFEKRVILGNGAQAKIRIGLPEDATRIFEVEKQPMTESLHGQRTF